MTSINQGDGSGDNNLMFFCILLHANLFVNRFNINERKILIFKRRKNVQDVFTTIRLLKFHSGFYCILNRSVRITFCWPTTPGGCCTRLHRGLFKHSDSINLERPLDNNQPPRWLIVASMAFKSRHIEILLRFAEILGHCSCRRGSTI